MATWGISDQLLVSPCSLFMWNKSGQTSVPTVQMKHQLKCTNINIVTMHNRAMTETICKSLLGRACVPAFLVRRISSSECLCCVSCCSVERPAVRRLSAGRCGAGLRPLWGRPVRWDSGIRREPRRDRRDHTGRHDHERVKNVQKLSWDNKNYVLFI